MKRRSKAGAEPVNGRRRKTAALKRRNGQSQRRRSSAAGPETRIARLTRERNEALERQRATAAVLSAISRSEFELQSILQSVVDTASQLCRADASVIFRLEGGVYRFAAGYSLDPVYIEHERRTPISPGPGTVIGRAAMTRKVVRIKDAWTDPLYEQKTAIKKTGGGRSMMGVPLMREGVPIGVIGLARSRVDPFAQHEVELVTTFADQAVIAIENARLFDEVQARTRELQQTLEYQTAASDVLNVISRSPSEIQPVLETIAETAQRLCSAEQAYIMRLDGGLYCIAAARDARPERIEYLKNNPIVPDRGSVTGRVAMERRTIHVTDAQLDPAYTLNMTGDAGYRSILGVPLLREGVSIGVIILTRGIVEPFTEKQIELVTTFADQAVIAIENARLFEAEQERTRELTESLQQQTATSKVLDVISRSAFDLKAVFETVAESSVKLCGAHLAFIYRFDGELLRAAIAYNTPREFKEWVEQHPIQPGRHSCAARTALERRTIHIPDILADPEYTFGTKTFDKIRTVLGVPILKGDELLGVILIYHQEVRPFTDNQIALVETFADQAAIAIENMRLLSELRESLQQQTATADVLKVISRSTFDLQTVLDTLIESAARLCAADKGQILMRDGDVYRIRAHHGLAREAVQYALLQPLRLDRGSMTGRVALDGKMIHIADALADPEYRATDYQRAFGYRTMLGIPLVRDGTIIGVFSLTRDEVNPFTDKQVELVTTFADQAVIAIENARLLDELRQRTEQLGRSVGELRALGEVSQAVNSTLDLETVLSTIVAKAVQLSGTDAGAIYVFDDEQREFHLRATYGMDRQLIDALMQQHIGLDDSNVILALTQREPTQIADLKEQLPSAVNEIILRAGFRALLVAPLLRGEEIVGLLVVRSRTPGQCAQSTIDLIKTFAAQSAVAIENARLFHDVEASLEDLRTAQDRLVQTEKLASLGQLTAGIAHEIKNPLNFVNNFSGVSGELLDELHETLAKVQADDQTHAEIDELLNTLRDNLQKIVQHGKRADSIVKNMLLHSREGAGEHRQVDINSIVEEALNLAYHGARAEKQGFNITLERSLDPAAGQVDCFPQEITRVLLNLISNGFYAATKRKAQATNDDFEPKLVTATRSLGDRVEIRIRDNGTGIPPDVRERIFNPFFTTKPAGEGTGLGLSISHDIIVKQHAGRIEVDTRSGDYTEFRIILPRAAAFFH